MKNLESLMHGERALYCYKSLLSVEVVLREKGG